jgi:hypothetical protein
MTKKRGTVLKRLGGLIPDVETIADLYDVDRDRAEVIQGLFKAVAEATKKLLKAQGDVIDEQADYIEEQDQTAQKIDRQVGRERDARTILNNIDVFLQGDIDSVQHVLEQVFNPTFAAAFGQLDPGRQRALFASLREAANSLQKIDGVFSD